jgi:hypothetical protein
MCHIILNNEQPCDLTKVLAYLCIHIQQEYDISPKIVNEIINLKEFSRHYHFLYNQLYTEMNINLNTFKYSFNPNENQISNDEYDKCGYLITSHQNTYISYCNAHKYLHPHPSLPDHNGHFNINHPFVKKNYNQIIEEKYKTTILCIYQSFINKLYHMIKRLFIYVIEEQFTASIVQIDAQKMSDIIEKMKTNDTVFKSRSVYEYLPPNNSNSKFYYVKVYQKR